MAVAAPPDTDLLARLALGDSAALASLYDRHSHLLYALAWRVLHNGADAEDVLQDAFTQAWRQADRFEAARGSVQAWLCIITRTRALDRLRQRRRAEGTPYRDGEVVPDQTPDTAVLDDRPDCLLRRAVAALPDSQRVPLELAFYEEMTHAQVAGVLGQPIGTVKTRIRLGLLKLRRAVATGRVAGSPAT